MTPLLVAEVSSNHNADLSRCLEFVDAAADAGCGAVKFQLFRVDQLFAPEILLCSEQHRKRKAWELPLDFIEPIAQRCHRRNVMFCCTPFYLEAVSELEPFVDFYKIASYELLWDELLIACAQTAKPLVLSTGMANLQEIDHAVEVIKSAGCEDLTLLHCVSAYPTPIDQCNLAMIETLRQRYQCKTGWSDHSVSPAVLLRAVQKWGAEMIEVHLDLDGNGEEYSAGHCWLPGDIRATAMLLDEGICADGSGAAPVADAEGDDRLWRTDPDDGLRPLKLIREKFLKSNQL